MSHFKTAVLFTKDQTITELMRPFEEEADLEFLVWNDQTEKVQYSWNEGTTKAVRMPDGRILFETSEEFRIPGTFGVGWDGGVCTTHKVPDYLKLEDVPVKEIYSDIVAFAREYLGYKVNGKGEFGYFENPNAKWDYWRLLEQFTDQTGAKAAVIRASEADLDTLNVWAFVTPDGKWFEKGKMGWWGMNDATEQSREEFNVALKKVLDNCGKDVYIALLDCHI